MSDVINNIKKCSCKKSAVISFNIYSSFHLIYKMLENSFKYTICCCCL